MRSNPLILEAIRSLTAAGVVQRQYWLAVLFQAVVLFVWWPKESLTDALEAGQGPGTLVAIATAVSLSLAFFAIRLGAEEIRSPGQQSLREWVLATGLKTSRVSSGYLAGVGLQLLAMLALSLPLLLMAYGAGGGTAHAFAWLLAMLWVQGLFFWLLAAVTYLLIGHYGALTYLGLRAALVLVIIGGLALYPVSSVLPVTRRLLLNAPPLTEIGDSIAPHVVFVALYAMTSVCLFLVLHGSLLRERRRAGSAAAESTSPP